MKNFSVRSIAKSRVPLAIVAGLLLASSFPKIGIAGFAWIAPGIILASAVGKSGRAPFWIGYFAGIAHYLAALYWLLLIPVTGFPILGWVVLCAYLALYPATWVAICFKLAGPRTPPPGEGSDWLDAARRIASWSWARRALWAFSCAATWVALEMLLARLFTGFPWDLLGVSQYRLTPLIQIASITGIYGISFLLVWTSVSLLCAIAAILSRPTFRHVWLGEVILPLTVIGAAFSFGMHRLREAEPAAPQLKLTLIQPSIPQTMIWDRQSNAARFQELVRLSETALANQTDVLVWPEAAVPELLRWDRETFMAVTNLAAKYHVWMIVGSDDAEPRGGSSDPKDADYYNCSFLVSPQGVLVDRYQKWGLVIFGEYIPLEHTLPFMKWFTPVTGSYTRGEKPVPFQMTFPARRLTERRGDTAESSVPPEAAVPESMVHVKTSVLICFEDIFPHLARRYADTNTDFLVNITNNGWFGEGAAQWQHAATSIFRAVENGLPLVRCANNGLTCWVDRHGRLRQVFRDQNGGIYGPGFLTVEVPLLAKGEKRGPTFYNEHGDWFGWGCAGFAVVMLGRAMVRRTPRDSNGGCVS